MLVFLSMPVLGLDARKLRQNNLQRADRCFLDVQEVHQVKGIVFFAFIFATELNLAVCF